jgi:hypothetical protein
MVNCLEGYKFEGDLGAELFAGVRVETGIPGIPDGPDLPIKFTAQAGVAASGGLSCNHFYAEDLQPIAFNAQKEGVRAELKKLMEALTYKAYLKQKACGFSSDCCNFMPEINYNRTNFHGLWTSHEATKVICAALEKAIKKSQSTDPKVVAEAESLLKNLRHYQENFKPSILTSLQISSRQAKGSAGLGASLEMKVEMESLGVSSSASAGVKASVTGSYIPINIRFQTAYPAIKKWPFVPAESELQEFVVMTQDTRILYEQYKCGASAKVEVTGNDKEIISSEKKSTLSELNRMTYITSTVFWNSPDKLHTYLIDKKKYTSTKQQTYTSNSLKGTGISFGGSFLLADLRKNLPKRYDPLATDLPENIALKRELDSFVPIFTDKVAITPIEEVSSPASIAMEIEIRKALNAYEKSFRGWKGALTRYQSSASMQAWASLRVWVEESLPRLGDAVAWLLNENGSHGHDQEFELKLKRRLSNPKSRFYGLLKKHYDIGKTKQDAEIKADKEQKSAMQRTKNAETKAYNLLLGGLDKLRNKKANDAWTKKSVAIKSRNEAVENKNKNNREWNEINRESNEFNKKQWDDRDKFLKDVADSLHVTLEQLKIFFNAKQCAELIHNSQLGVDAIILEAAFEVDDLNVTLQSSLVNRSSGFFRSNPPKEEIIELAPKTATEMHNRFDVCCSDKTYPNPNTPKIQLNAIRMRYRIQDLNERKEKPLFKLGFKILGNGAGIQLNKIEDAGSEGIIDLHVEWFSQETRPRSTALRSESELKETHNSESKFDETRHYEQGVPPVALFCN